MVQFFAGIFPNSSVRIKGGFEPKHEVKDQMAEINEKECPLMILNSASAKLQLGSPNQLTQLCPNSSMTSFLRVSKEAGPNQPFPALCLVLCHFL